MKKVFIYGFSGTYLGSSKYEWNPPKAGEPHKCLLFLRQDLDEVDFELAKVELEKFGVHNILDLKGNSLKVETLNSDMYKGFSGFYESALTDGSCLVYYPNT